CGGYQMLGRSIHDPDGVEGPAAKVDGLGLLDVETVMSADKQVRSRHARALSSGVPVTGYEIHMGRTSGRDCARAWLDLDGRPEGAAARDGRVRGSYLHGLFSADGFRAEYLAMLGAESVPGYEDGVDDVLDRLADHLERHMDLDLMLSLAEEPHRA
ncbi:cobyric acid synthase CobQ, partial [Cribrihabitans sp. XS_ASV171]